MKNKRAAISIEMVVYVAIAVFVLVIVIGFATGAFQKLFPWLVKNDLKDARDTCEVLCSDVQGDLQAKGISVWENSDYCIRKFPIKDSSGVTVYPLCWQDPIKESCEGQAIVGGKTYICKPEDESADACGPCEEAPSI